jgi:quercetin dioxygenase-like cupin family protein
MKLLLSLLAAALFSESVAAQQNVPAPGVSVALKLEEVISGHLTELNGKFKLRASEITIAPGGQLGAHHHAGPGFRLVLSGELTFTQAGKSIVYRTGEYFYESGNVVHTAENRTKAPVRVAMFEILPVQWTGPSVIAPKLH